MLADPKRGPMMIGVEACVHVCTCIEAWSFFDASNSHDTTFDSYRRASGMASIVLVRQSDLLVWCASLRSDLDLFRLRYEASMSILSFVATPHSRNAAVSMPLKLRNTKAKYSRR